MPAYGTRPVSLVPGDKWTLFDGTEAVAEGLESMAIARGYSPSGDDAGTSFFATGLAADMVIDIQAAAVDDDDEYLMVGQITDDGNGNGAYTDIGRPGFYRAVITTYSAGDMPIVRVQR